MSMGCRTVLHENNLPVSPFRQSRAATVRQCLVAAEPNAAVFEAGHSRADFAHIWQDILAVTESWNLPPDAEPSRSSAAMEKQRAGPQCVISAERRVKRHRRATRAQCAGLPRPLLRVTNSGYRREWRSSCIGGAMAAAQAKRYCGDLKSSNYLCLVSTY
jgi:hypothetical protein